MRKVDNSVLCCVCGKAYSSHFDGKPYCSIHYQRMRRNGTPELVARKSTSHYHAVENCGIIETSKGGRILVDADDSELLMKYSWCISKAGYAVARIGGKVQRMNRFLLGVDRPDLLVDHVNGNRLDNRKSNLRVCVQSQNAKNKKTKKNNSSGYSGIRCTPHGKFNVRITVDNKEIHIGNYSTFEDAIKARKKAEQEYFREYARDEAFKTQEGVNG